MLKNKYFLFGILIGLLIVTSIKPILTQANLSLKYESQIQERLREAFPNIECSASIQIKYYTRYLAYGDIINGKDKHFFVLHPLYPTTYYPVKVFVD